MELVIYGAGGHGQVVAAAALAAGLSVLGFLDDQPRHDSTSPPLAPAHQSLPRLDHDDPRLDRAAVCPGIGDNAARARCLESLHTADRPLRTVIHPHSTVETSASIGPGCYIGPNAVVHVQASIGTAAIINSAAVVEHHAVIGDLAHIAPGAVLGGQVRVGDQALIGLGARVLPRIQIGPHAVVGAGAVVTHNLGAGQTVMGVPAREP